ncbi:stalk domain-containing protein [Cohnella mopanensis]|uniref:stalk domain-containing protein n=1 Tax=Cohnella mopanensis TaxID=2911966 RepID=UPI001EF892C2|nr:stalk domain-containing protein [Cohnella mopanensis]
MNKKKIGAVGLALAVLLGSQATPSLAATTSAPATQVVSTDYSEMDKATQVLNYLNSVRTAMGLSAVKLNQHLTQAAQNHAGYIAANGDYNHDENPHGKRFTGVTHVDRINAVGGDTLSQTWEIMTVDEADPKAIIEEFLNTAYHREPLISPDATEIGFGMQGSAVVMEIACAANTMGYVMYPYDGQTDVVTTFSGHEIPNPIAPFGVAQSGQIITLKTPYLLSSIDVTFTNRSGEGVPFFEPFTASNYWHIVPKSPLAYNETYTVTVTFTPWTGSDAGKIFNKTWSFTTENDNPTSTTPSGSISTDHSKTTTTTTSIISTPYSRSNIGIKINGEYVAVNSKPQMINNSIFIPLRGVFEVLSAKVFWHQIDHSIEITKGSTKIHLQLGNKTATVNGKKITLTSAPFTSKEGSTYVPLRFASEALDANVIWDADNWTAVIDAK